MNPTSQGEVMYIKLGVRIKPVSWMNPPFRARSPGSMSHSIGEEALNDSYDSLMLKPEA
jgi:hypothetical protein